MIEIPLILLASGAVTALAIALGNWAGRDASLRGIPVPIASAKEGQLVKIRGRVVQEVSCEAPFSGASCAFFRIRIQSNSTLHTESSETLVIEGDDGVRAIVEVGASTTFHLKRDFREFRGVFPLRGRLEAELRKRVSLNQLSARKVAAEEYRLEAGDEVIVVGHATWKQPPQDEVDYRRAAQEHLVRIVAPRSRPLVLSELDEHLEQVLKSGSRDVSV